MSEVVRVIVGEVDVEDDWPVIYLDDSEGFTVESVYREFVGKRVRITIEELDD